MKRAALFIFMFPPLAACSPDQSSLNGNLSGNAAAILDAQANMLEERADNMVAAAEAAITNSSGLAANATAGVSAQDGAAE